jgi:N-carbamoylputrescine amidase
MQESSFRVGLVQMRCGTDPDANLARALDGIAEAAGRGAQIVCLQELFRTQYFCQKEDPAAFDLAEAIPGPTTEALGRTAARHGVVVVGSLFERRSEGVFHNTAVVLETDGSLAGIYRKMHIPDDPLYYEKYFFAPGDLGFRSFKTQVAAVGTLVCWDQWFPEAARMTALSGAELLCYPTAIGWHPAEKEELGVSQHAAWETIQRSHAIANGVFVADPFGNVIARASQDREEVLVVECDRRRIADTRRNWPFLRDRRIDAYDGLRKRYLD